MATAGAGAAAGAYGGWSTRHTVTGAATGALIGAGSARLLDRAFSSPAWRVLPAATKDKLARAISSGDASTVRRLVTPVIAAAAASRGNDQALGRRVHQNIAQASHDMAQPDYYEKNPEALVGMLGGIPEGLNAGAIREVLKRDGINVAEEVAPAVVRDTKALLEKLAKDDKYRRWIRTNVDRQLPAVPGARP
jgi:hypothetical protein